MDTKTRTIAIHRTAPHVGNVNILIRLRQLAPQNLQVGMQCSDIYVKLSQSKILQFLTLIIWQRFTKASLSACVNFGCTTSGNSGCFMFK